VLVVDDDESIRVLLERVLSPLYEVCTAANGVAALDEIRRQHPDLVVLDLNMPQMDGWELLQRLEQAGAEVAVVLLSGEQARAWPDSPLVKARIRKGDVLELLRDACRRIFPEGPCR
jgi:CheY-like chemotaxis protein